MMANEALASIVGRSNFLTDLAARAEYSFDSNGSPPVIPACVVKPGNADEVSEIVKWASETSTPLVPVSSGAPHGRGDTCPISPDAVMLCLDRMKRIIRIDPRNRIAMVEPGVTFGELQAALAEQGLCAYLPLGPRTTKSVIGSMLEREPITRPSLHWDSTDPLLCTEVVFGTGDRFRTGEASGPETIEEQWEMGRFQMNPFGHSHVDFHRLLSGAEGTMGIVTWATLKCSPLPVSRKVVVVPSSDLAPLIDLTYSLVKFRFGGTVLILNGLNLACLVGKEQGEINDMAKGLPPWALVVTFEGYGILPEEKVAREESDFRSMARACGLSGDTVLAEPQAQKLLFSLSRPSEPHWKTRVAGGFRDLFFLTTLDKTPAFAASMGDLAAKGGFPPDRMGVYIQPIVQGTSCHCEFDFYFDPRLDDGVGRAERIVREGAEGSGQAGGFFSRPYPAWKAIAYRGSPAAAAMQKKIKSIFDPKGILNPGKLCF
jgi:FAD/FMN-containing dehydrogenase